MKFIRYILIILLITNGLFANSFGYLKEVEASFCMDICSEYMLEDEDGVSLRF